MKAKFIEIKNAQKVFKHTLFKIRGHDFLRLIDDIKNKVNTKQGIALINFHKNMEEKHGDYEVYIRVFPGKIEINNFLED